MLEIQSAIDQEKLLFRQYKRVLLFKCLFGEFSTNVISCCCIIEREISKRQNKAINVVLGLVCKLLRLAPHDIVNCHLQTSIKDDVSQTTNYK